jgi:hypothetical protein
MAITTTTKTIVDGEKMAIIQFTGVFSDATGNETDAVKVDASALSPPAGPNNPLKVMRLWYSCSAVGTYLEFDGNNGGGADGFIMSLPQDAQGYVDFRSIGGFYDNSTIPTGDITLTTTGTVAAAQGYSVIIEVSKT